MYVYLGYYIYRQFDPKSFYAEYLELGRDSVNT